MKNPLATFKNYYTHNMKMQSKFMVSHLILVIVPTLILGLTFYNQLYDLIVSNTIRSEQAVTEQTVTAINTTLEQILSTVSTVSESTFMQELTQDSSVVFSADRVTSDQTSAFTNLILSQSNSNITNIKIYCSENMQELYSAAETSEVFKPLSKAYGTHWYGIMNSTASTSLFCPPFYLSPSEISSYGQLAYIQKFAYQDNGEVAAYCVIYFSQVNMNNILQQNVSLANSASYILNEREAIVASSDSSLAGVYRLPYQETIEATSGPNTYITKTIQDVDFYMGYYEINNTDWILVSVLPAGPIVQKGTQLVQIFVIIYLAVLGLAFFLTLILSRSISNRISTLANQMRSIRSRSGRPIRMKDSTGKDEIEDLIDTYNYMTDEIGSLMDKQEQAAKDMRSAEFKALQAQINPHFLYNSLDMINWLAKSGKTDEVTNAIQALSKFYKLTLSKKDTIVTVEKEIEHISLYVQLQNMRYEDKIHLFIDVPDDLLDYQIPRLIFQPIVENSIQHGIFERPEKEGNIVLTGWLEGGTIVFLLSDNGVGIPPETIAGILSADQQTYEPALKGSNIGIYNTHSRLQLLYGTEYGLSYTSAVGQGTDVEIRIPAITG